ncbi:MAG: PadR family transcriptional regulator [Saccharofermentans sp.]|nr:PadR family transcriptional regulator [Saccharofermentans sp.]
MNNQFKKGVLDLCVLTILSKGDSYGYDVADTLSQKIQLSDGTVYPILRKLASDGYVSTYLKESQNGPPRKYYHLTDEGKKLLVEEKNDWDTFTKAVKEILEGIEE